MFSRQPLLIDSASSHATNDTIIRRTVLVRGRRNLCSRLFPQNKRQNHRKAIKLVAKSTVVITTSAATAAPTAVVFRIKDTLIRTLVSQNEKETTKKKNDKQTTTTQTNKF